MFIRAELAEKLNKLADFLLASINDKDEGLASLETRIANKTLEIDTLKEKKRDLEIEIKVVEAKNKLDRDELEAGFNREKKDINHLVALNKEKDDQKTEHDKKMLELQFQEKSNSLEREFNERYKKLIESRDKENKELLAAHMQDIKEMNSAILKRLPDISLAVNKK